MGNNLLLTDILLLEPIRLILLNVLFWQHVHVSQLSPYQGILNIIQTHIADLGRYFATQHQNR